MMKGLRTEQTEFGWKGTSVYPSDEIILSTQWPSPDTQ